MHIRITERITMHRKTQRIIPRNPFGEENLAKLLHYRFVNKVQCQYSEELKLSHRKIPQNNKYTRDTE